MSTIRALLPHDHQYSTSFEVLTACIWQCRTKALQQHWQQQNDNNLDDHEEVVQLLGIVNARYGHCRFNPPLPIGFYGNASVVCLPAITTVGKLCSEPLEYALKLVKEAKGKATEEYVHSVVDFMATKGRPWFKRFGCFVVSDLSKAALNDVDFGWGKAVYAGPPNILVTEASFFVPFTNSKGERGRVVIICLPGDAMERFEKELNHMLKIKN